MSEKKTKPRYSSVETVGWMIANAWRECKSGGNDLKRLSSIIADDHLLIIVSARRGSISFRPSLDHVFVQLQRDYRETSVLLIYPNGYTVDGDLV